MFAAVTRRECVGESEDCQQRQQQQSRTVKERHGYSYARIVEFNAVVVSTSAMLALRRAASVDLTDGCQ